MAGCWRGTGLVNWVSGHRLAIWQANCWTLSPDLRGGWRYLRLSAGLPAADWELPGFQVERPGLCKQTISAVSRRTVPRGNVSSSGFFSPLERQRNNTRWHSSEDAMWQNSDPAGSILEFYGNPKCSGSETTATGAEARYISTGKIKNKKSDLHKWCNNQQTTMYTAAFNLYAIDLCHVSLAADWAMLTFSLANFRMSNRQLSMWLG